MWTQKVRQNNIVNFLVNEFGTVPDSFRLVSGIFSRCSSSLCTLPDSGRIRPLSETFRRRTFLLLIYQRSFPLRYYPSSYLYGTYFVLCYALAVVSEILSFGIASLGRSVILVMNLLVVYWTSHLTSLLSGWSLDFEILNNLVSHYCTNPVLEISIPCHRRH